MATSSKPLISSGKNGFVMSDTISPRIRLRPETSERACVLGKYRSSSIAFQTRLAVLGSTSEGLLIVRDTVAVETLARRATSWIFISGTLYLNHCALHNV